MKTENVDPMNTEQLKTAEQIYEDNVGSNMELGYIRTPKENVIQAMESFSSQESKRAVDEFKEKLENELLNARLWVDAEVNKSYIEHVVRFIKKL